MDRVVYNYSILAVPFEGRNGLLFTGEKLHDSPVQVWKPRPGLSLSLGSSNPALIRQRRE